MRRPIFHHRMLSAAALAAFFLTGSLQAREPAVPAAPQDKSEESGISTPRRVAGLGVLAFLIGWMIWRNGGRRQRHDEQAREDHDTEPRE